jgi:hypothetical protein
MKAAIIPKHPQSTNSNVASYLDNRINIELETRLIIEGKLYSRSD